MGDSLIVQHPRKTAGGTLAAGLLLGGTLITGFEGTRTHAYLDSGRIATICDGIIVYEDGRRVKLGDVASTGYCADLKAKDLQRRIPAMQNCLKRPVSPVTAAWMISYGYNVGTGRFCRSVAPLVNQGRMIAACAAMRYPNTAKGVVIRGLDIRRRAESAGCLRGLA